MPFDHDFVTEFLAQPDQLIIDVRTIEEYQEGHIEGALLLPLPQLVRGSMLSLLRNQKCVGVYCAHGVRSWQACLYLRQHHIEVIDLGGIVDYLGPLVIEEKESE